MRNLSTLYPGKVIIDGNNPDGTFKNETTPDVTNDGTPNDEAWAQDLWGFTAHLLNKVGVSPDAVQENEATSQIYDALATAVRTLWTATEIAKGSSFLPKRIILSNGTDSDHDIDTTVGNFKFSGGDGTANIAAFVKQIDQPWAAGTAAGGMNDGETVQTGTTYHYFALSNADGSVVDCGFDSSTTAAGLLADTAVVAAGLTKYKLLGSVLTNGSANIKPFIQDGIRFRLLTRTKSTSTLVGGPTTAVTLLGDTPVGRKTLGQFGFVVADNATNFVIFTSSDEVDEVPAVTNCDLATPSTSDGDTAHMDIVTDTSSQIRGRQSTGALDTFEMYTRGWVDFELDD